MSIRDPQVCDVCRQSNMPAGIFGIDGDAAKHWIAQGFTLIAVGIDTLLLAAAAGDALAALTQLSGFTPIFCEFARRTPCK